VNIQVLYVKEDREKELPLSLLDQPNADDGIAGAKLGIADDNTTGRFLNQTFKMDVLEGNLDDLIKGATEKVVSGDAFIIADMEPDSLLKFADALKDKPAQIFNVGNPDDRLREEDCRANVMHTAPTRTQLADALAQYLVWKRWPNWLMVVGPSPKDQLLADAYRRAAKKFGAKIVEELPFKVDTGNRRADGGFEQIQQQIPQFMQNAKDHDVVLVIDEDQVFADYFAYRTWVPRPIVGSAGLVPSSWHPALELWGGTQFQNRFKRLTGRIMRPLDYDAWVATRTIGEAASRKQTSDFKTLRDFMHAPDFEVAAFKGVATSFRSWNGQLREPLIVSTPKLLVSVSPQQGFLHQFSVLDTLGIDKPETKCKAYTQ
jgi:ABC transporter substrate binding protein (PQQ-dependent alcohol dehydrogenase system)